ncbi:hypothetical protein [Nitrococcus mobilis]|nr:hypothetical protein [Nitrococcus mobilis]
MPLHTHHHESRRLPSGRRATRRWQPGGHDIATYLHPQPKCLER